MTLTRLLARNLAYHWRGNLAVFLGVALGTAVLTGALLVGDSLRGSLRALALDQLGWVDQAMVTPRFFREELAGKLSARRAAPILLLQGSASLVGPDRQSTRRAGKVTVLGVDDRFWDQGVPSDVSVRKDATETVTLNASLADALGARVGDTIRLHVQKADNIPRETLLGKRKAQETIKPLEARVQRILPDRGLGRFTLKPSPESPRNAFVPLPLLQRELDLGARVNAVLIAGASGSAEESLRSHLTLDDWSLTLRTPADRAAALVRLLTPRDRPVDGTLRFGNWSGRVPDELAKMATNKILTQADIEKYYRRVHNYLSLESRQLFLEPSVEKAMQALTRNHPDMSTAPTLVYLADALTDTRKEIPYAVVAATETLARAPLGSFQTPGTEPLAPDEIILTERAPEDGSPLSPLLVKPGEPVTLLYYLPDAQGQLQKHSAKFRVREILPLRGAADDPFLTPEFPGITDRRDISDIRQEDLPFPYDEKRTRPAHVNQYWTRYRTSPRAYVSLARGQQLWGSRFGNVTSIRLAIADDDLARAEKIIREKLLRELKPEQGGFVFDDVRERSLQAGAGSADFGTLFLAFSVFLIVAALLLVGLLFRLNLDRRAIEIGLLLAVGLRRKTVRCLLLAEGSALAGVGAVAGLLAALLYADLLIRWLSVRWPGEQRLSFLELHASASSFLIGYAASLLVSVLTIAWAVRALGKLSPRELLTGETTASEAGAAGEPRRWSRRIALAAALGAIGCLAAAVFASGHQAQAMSFFGSGACVLMAGLTGVWDWLRRRTHDAVATGPAALTRLGVRNAARHPVRSLLTIGLLASATFLVVAVESFHREAGSEFFAKNGGSGGFRLLAETDVPLFQNLNDAGPQALGDATVYPFRLRPGDDASCLNLYQPLRPRLLGVPSRFVERGGFHFRASLGKTPEEKENPWRLLEQAQPDDATPVIADANSAEWILKVPLGGTLTIPDESGASRKLRIVALLEESIFQSELLMAQDRFQKLFPHQEGAQFFLIETGPEQTAAVKSAVEAALAAQGGVVTPTEKRLEAYLAVENTYLETFQALGGLGLLLGAVGLAVVLVRSVWERRGELALLRALGFRHRRLGWLVLAENGALLGLGLAVGTGAALVAVAPHLAGGLLWWRLLRLLLLVLGVGLVSATAAMLATLRAPLIAALRRD